MDLHLQNAFLVLFASFHQEELFSNSLRMDHAMNLVLQKIILSQAEIWIIVRQTSDITRVLPQDTKGINQETIT